MVVAIGLAGNGPTTASPLPSAAPTVVATSDEPTPQPAPRPAAPAQAGTVDPAAFVGTWKTLDGSPRDTVLTIDRAGPAEQVGLSITISGAPECSGSDLRGSTTGRPAGSSMVAHWALTCTSGGTGATFEALYTYDPASGRLSDSQGMTYTKQ